MRIILTLMLSISLYLGYAQSNARLVDARGQTSSVDRIIQAAKGKRFIFVGEMHGEAAAHRLELELLQQLYALHGDRLVLGMEMFETDVQPIVDEYWLGLINTKSFESEARIWGNYADYRPIVEFARAHQIPLIATNVPRRYANAIYHQGIAVLESLSDYAKNLLPPLPMPVDSTLSSYRELKNMIPGHGGENMLYSQAIKDASMAHRILTNAQDGQIVLHLNGAYHSKNREGILSFMPEVTSEEILTITVRPDDGENTAIDEADFTLIVAQPVGPDKQLPTKQDAGAADSVHTDKGFHKKAK